VNRRTACGLTLWAVGLLCAHCLAQQPPVPTKPAPDANGAEAAKPAIDPIAEAREELRAAETAHPGNTEEVANALNKLVGIEIGERKDPEESLDLAKRSRSTQQNLRECLGRCRIHLRGAQQDHRCPQPFQTCF